MQLHEDIGVCLGKLRSTLTGQTTFSHLLGTCRHSCVVRAQDGNNVVYLIQYIQFPCQQAAGVQSNVLHLEAVPCWTALHITQECWRHDVNGASYGRAPGGLLERGNGCAMLHTQLQAGRCYSNGLNQPPVQLTWATEGSVYIANTQPVVPGAAVNCMSHHECDKSRIHESSDLQQHSFGSIVMILAVT